MINYKITETTDHLVVGRFDFDTTKNIVAEVLDTIDPELLHPPEIGGHDDSLEDNDVRKGTITWLDDCNDTSNLLRQLIDEVNVPRWNYFLDDDNPSIQFTMYADEGDHYDWHKDQYEEHDDYIRKVSISVCLSHDDEYEGAELFVKDGSETNVRVFKMKYGEFVIFPSDVEHRVNELRSGERVSLVAWYGNEVWTKSAIGT